MQLEFFFTCSFKFCVYVEVYIVSFPPHASPLLLIGGITLSPLLQMEDSEGEEQEEEEESEEFNVMPPYSEKDSNAESGARGSRRGAAGRAVPALPLLLLLPSLVLDWK